MPLNIKLRQTALLVGDLVMLYLALLITLFIRYGAFQENIDEHLVPFTALFGFFLITFYVSGLYEIQALKNSREFTNRFQTALVASLVLGIAFFYILPVGITPKVNLSIFFVIFWAVMYGWRLFFSNLLSAGSPEKRVLLLGYNQVAEELARHLEQHPELGYEIKLWMKEGVQDKKFKYLSDVIGSNNITTIVVPAHIKKSARAARLIYKNLLSGIEVLDLSDLYEAVFKKVPLAELEEVWFLENLAKSHKIYETLKRPVEIILASALILATLPLFAFFAAAIKLTSFGAIIFSQTRVGQNENVFIIYKFRTMRKDAEIQGPQWAQPHDQRVTAFGHFLRRSHLDEMPQLWNVLWGMLSLIGPRPERPEFVATLEKEIPFYELRHLIRPGITGWAQVNYRYGASIDDAYEKLQYDMYYLKNRSLALDALIILKTIRFLFLNLT